MTQHDQTARFGYQSYSNINDLCSHTSLINEWDFLYHQVSAGKFSSQLNSFWLDGIGIYQEFLSPSVFQQGKARDDIICIGVFRNIQQPALWMGTPVDENNIVCIYPNNEIMIKTPDDSVFYALHFQAKLLNNDQDAPLNSAMNSLKNKKMSTQLYQKMMQIITFLQQDSPPKLTDLARHYLRSDMIELGDCYMRTLQQHVTPPATSKTKAKEVVQYLLHYLMEHKEQPISMDKCCQLTQMSQRTLQNYFEMVTGQSPSLFLKNWRLNGVRRMLQHPKRRISIGDAASYWGFWHLSQFSTDYKRLFSEIPSETLLMR